MGCAPTIKIRKRHLNGSLRLPCTLHLLLQESVSLSACRESDERWRSFGRRRSVFPVAIEIQPGRRLRRIAEDHVRSPFRDHHHRGINVAIGDVGHPRRSTAHDNEIERTGCHDCPLDTSCQTRRNGKSNATPSGWTRSRQRGPGRNRAKRVPPPCGSAAVKGGDAPPQRDTAY